MIKYSF